MIPLRERWAGLTARLKTLGGPLLFTLLLTIMPLAAWAQEDDDEKMTIDPQTAAAQNRTLGLIVLVVVLAVLWYFWRRWQTTHKRQP